MKRVFNFKEGDRWDGDENIVHYLEDQLLEEDESFMQQIKADFKVTVIVEKKK